MAQLVRQSRGAGLLRNAVLRGAGGAAAAAPSPTLSTSSSAPASATAGVKSISIVSWASSPPPPERCRSMSSSSHVSWDYRGQRKLLPLGLKVPDVAVDAWVAPNALLAGEVIVQDRSSIWYGVVMRGDLNRVKVGPLSSVGDKSVLHAAESSWYGISVQTDIGKYVTVGPYCTLRSCNIENEVVIGQRCIIMEGSIVQKNAMLASGTVVPPGRRIPGGEVWAGNPARFVREVTADEIALIPKLAEEIYEIAQTHSSEYLPYTTAYLEVEKLLGDSKLVV